ncbi:MAG: hypothetical protein WC047_00045 [Kiritimatiellales bacterium]
MFLPTLDEAQKTRDYNMEFKGYNHNLYVKNGQFYDMQNLTSKYYPALAPRSRRGKIRQLTKPNGLFAKNKLCWVDGTNFYYNNAIIGTVADSVKQFVGMGAYILIFPDKKLFNTSTLALTSLVATFTAAVDATVTYALSKVDASAYGSYTASDAAPESPTNGQLWVDTSVTPNVLKSYSTTSALWVSVPTTYIKIGATGIGTPFTEGDSVTITGSTVTDLNATGVIVDKGTDYIVMTGILTAAASQTGSLVVQRKVPDMDFVTECNNRLWGCSSTNHEVYACKLGDPTNWYTYTTLADASFAATIGSDGDFTGAYTHRSTVYFFKEDSVHQVMGVKPPFSIDEVKVRGVQKGSEKSLALLNETLFYKARTGICAFDGSEPFDVSRELGTGRYDNAVAGAYDGRYYVSMQDESDAWHLFVFDEAAGMWHREDATHALYFAYLDGEMYYVDSAGWLWTIGGTLTAYTATPDVATQEAAVSWIAETGDIGMELPDHKYVTKIQLRVSIDTSATMKAYVQYDSSGTWVEKGSMTATSRKSITFQITPQRCDHMKIKLTGTGGFRLYAISKVVEQGSEM